METVTKQLEASRSESADLRAQVTEREQVCALSESMGLDVEA